MADDAHAGAAPSRDVLDRAAALASGGDRVRLGDIIDACGARGYGPMIALLAGATVALTPLPATSSILGVAIALVGGQYAASAGGRVRAPQVLRRLDLDAAKVKSAIEALRPAARRIDAVVTRRAEWLTRGWFAVLWGVLVVVLAILLVPLSLTPGGTVPVAILLAVIGVAITARDGWLLAGAGGLTVLLFVYGTRLLI